MEWEIELNEIDDFLDIQIEKIKVRKAILAFMGVKEKKKDYTDEEYLESISHFKHR